MLKMHDLVKYSRTPKSTILYYIKEGLLPAPLKDKPNFHLYDEHCIELLEFILYLQTNFNASISQIKTLFADEKFDRHHPYESLIYSLSTIMGAENDIFTPQQLCAEFGLTENELNGLVEKGILSPRDGIFTTKERDILAIVSRCDETERAIIDVYLQNARILAAQEVALTLEALAKSEQKNVKLKHLFDLLLVLKPYIFNMQTLNTYHKESIK